MALVNKIEKKARIADYWDIIKFQLISHCFLNKIHISDSELDCLTLLCMEGEQELTEFCFKVQNKKIFKSAQTARNSVTKAEQKGLIVKVGKNKKKVSIHPSINVQIGNVLLTYNFLYIETSKS